MAQVVEYPPTKCEGKRKENNVKKTLIIIVISIVNALYHYQGCLNILKIIILGSSCLRYMFTFYFLSKPAFQDPPSHNAGDSN
jgi:hypothetical protein